MEGQGSDDVSCFPGASMGTDSQRAVPLILQLALVPKDSCMRVPTAPPFQGGWKLPFTLDRGIQQEVGLLSESARMSLMERVWILSSHEDKRGGKGSFPLALG